jgi:hypothetical protein
MNAARQPVPILVFADAILGIRPYDWQCKILLNYEAGNRTAAACANNTGKTSLLFPVCALWLLWTEPKARLMYLTASGDQLKHQFFSYIRKYADRRAFAGWQWLDVEVRNASGGFLFGRSTDSGGRIEGLHDSDGSPAALLVDEAKSILPEIADTLERCNVSHRLDASSTGPAFGWFYDIMTGEGDGIKRFTVPSSMCQHVDPASIKKDREELKDNVFRIKHGAEFLYDEGTSMIGLEHVRGLLAAQRHAASGTMVPVPQLPKHPPGALNEHGIPYADAEKGRRLFVDPPRADRNAHQATPVRVTAYVGSVLIVSGPVCAFCDFAGGSDYNAFAVCDGNIVWIEDDWREKDTMATVGRFISLFKKMGLSGYQIGGDQGFGGALMDRLAEHGYHLKRVRNGDPAQNKKDFFNADAERWSLVGKLIQNRQIIIKDAKPDRLERLVKQLTSRQKIYDSDGRERLEPKDKMKARGLRSPDLADAVVGAVCMGPGSRPYAANPGLLIQEQEAIREVASHMERNRSPFYVPYVDFSRVW